MQSPRQETKHGGVMVVTLEAIGTLLTLHFLGLQDLLFGRFWTVSFAFSRIDALDLARALLSEMSSDNNPRPTGQNDPNQHQTAIPMTTSNNPPDTTATPQVNISSTNPPSTTQQASTTPAQTDRTAVDQSNVIQAADPSFRPTDSSARVRPMNLSTLPVEFTVNHATFYVIGTGSIRGYGLSGQLPRHNFINLGTVLHLSTVLLPTRDSLIGIIFLLRAPPILLSIVPNRQLKQ